MMPGTLISAHHVDNEKLAEDLRLLADAIEAESALPQNIQTSETVGLGDPTEVTLTLSYLVRDPEVMVRPSYDPPFDIDPEYIAEGDS